MKKKNLKSKVDFLIEGLIGRLEKIEKIAVEEFPEICKEIIAERNIEIENNCILSGSIFLLSLLVFIYTFLIALNTDKGDLCRVFCGIGALVAGIFAILGGFDLLVSLLSLRELKAAPKLYALRELRKMIKKN